jgi:hypothetical protein
VVLADDGRVRKRPCRYCRRWFSPDHRVGERQRACSSEACQRKRRAATQAAWRRANPDYRTRRWIRERERDERRECVAVPAPLDRLPWDLGQEEFDRRGADFLACFGKVVVDLVKDQRRAEVVDCTGETGRLPPWAVKDQWAP